MIAFEFDRAPSVKLRTYQDDALQGVLREVERGIRRTLLVMPTGSGKTVVFSALADTLGLSSHERVLILAHRDELVEQARDKYLRANPRARIGIEKGTAKAESADGVVVGSVQTLRGARLEEFIGRWGLPALVITDEAHHATSTSYVTIYDRIGIVPGGDVLHVGVTATPKRGDGEGLDKVFDSIAYAVTIEDLIIQGYLVDLRGYVVKSKVVLPTAMRHGDFKVAQLAAAVNITERNASVVNAYLELARGRRAIVFCVDIAHSKAQCELFIAAGVRTIHVDGEMPLRERRAAVAGFEAGRYDVLTNCDVLSEGFDCPAVDCVILAAPTAKSGKYAQRVGRGTRPLNAAAAQFASVTSAEGRRAIIRASGKRDCIVIDVVDVTKRHSLASLPALLGLPAGFDLRGKSALRSARKFNALAAVTDLAETLVTDADALEALDAVPAAQRVRALVRSLLKNKGTQEYIPVDLLQPKPLPPWAQDAASMTWFASGPAAFRLNLPEESLLVEQTTLAQYEATLLPRPPHPPTRLGVFGTLREAFGRAEAWVRQQRESMVELLDRNAAWRARPASSMQRGYLRHQGVRARKSATRGDLSSVISMLKGERG